MSGGPSGGLRTRVKTAKGRKIGSTRWLERQLNDPYVKRARAEGYRSRAAYKLIELDERFGFLKGARNGRRSRHRAGRLDSGGAPARPGLVGRRHRSAADRPDRRRDDPAAGFHGRRSARAALARRLAVRPTSSSPTWPPIPSAIRRPIICARWGWSRRRSTSRVEVLRPGGAFVAKVLAGGADASLVAELKRRFATVKHAKPPGQPQGLVRMVCRWRRDSKARIRTRLPPAPPRPRPSAPCSRPRRRTRGRRSRRSACRWRRARGPGSHCSAARRGAPA